MDTAPYDRLLAEQVAGRRVVLVAPLGAVSDDMCEDLRARGATGVFVIGLGRGTGPGPSTALADRHVLPIRADDVMTQIRTESRLLADPPSGLVDALHRFDPRREAVVLGNAFSTSPTVAGRRVFGGRPPGYLRYDDKVAVDALWDLAGVARVPVRVVPCAPEPVAGAASELDRGAGVVLAADASRGWHGGAHGTRWARTQAELAEAVLGLSPQAEVVRVMPFLEGVPCSVHGMVFRERTIVFRPMELVILRRPGTTDLVYAGSSSTWDPPPDDRTAMRAAAVAVGDALRREQGYRGGFTIDGVLTADGFRPTELNTRLGSAFTHIASVTPEIPWGALQRALVEGMPVGGRPAELEAHALAAADATRSVRGVLFGSWRQLEETVAFGLRLACDRRLETVDGDGEAGAVQAGPHPTGMMVLLRSGTEVVRPGERAGSFVAEAMTVVARRLGIDPGPLMAAPTVR